jgi:NADP-dependent 3-hydroxy acid dehydrogenase YdfG
VVAFNKSGMYKSFNNQVAVVTGAASGLGFSIAKQLSLEGVRLALIDHHFPAPDIFKDELQGDFETYPIDITTKFWFLFFFFF